MITMIPLSSIGYFNDMNNTDDTMNSAEIDDANTTKYCGHPISNDDAAVRTDNLWKKIDGRWIVRNMNMKIRRGTLLALMGPNGSGKTSTSRLIVGMLHPSRGHVYIDGIEMNDETGAMLRSRMGCQVDGNAYMNMTVYDNLDLWAEIYNLNRKTKKHQIDKLINMLTLDAYAGMEVRELSKGNRQKVMIARALLPDPYFIFLDEPTSGIDPQSSTALMHMLHDRCVKEGITVFMNTHRLQGLDGIVNNIGVMENGSLIEYGDVNMMIAERWPMTEYTLTVDRHWLENDADNADIVIRTAAPYADASRNKDDYTGEFLDSFDLKMKADTDPYDLLHALVCNDIRVVCYTHLKKTIQDLYLDKVQAGDWEEAE